MSFPGDSVRFPECLWCSNTSSLSLLFNETIDKLPSHFLDKLEILNGSFFPNQKKFHVEDATRTQQWAALKGGLAICTLGRAAQQSRLVGCTKGRAGGLHNRAAGGLN